MVEGSDLLTKLVSFCLSKPLSKLVLKSFKFEISQIPLIKHFKHATRFSLSAVSAKCRLALEMLLHRLMVEGDLSSICCLVVEEELVLTVSLPRLMVEGDLSSISCLVVEEELVLTVLFCLG